MTIDDGRQSEQSGTPPEETTASDQNQGAGSTVPQAGWPTAETTAETPAGPPPAPAAPQPGWPPAPQPTWPPAPQSWPPSPQGWPPAPSASPSGQPGWPPAAQPSWPPAPPSPQSWPQAPQAPQSWPPALQPTWPPAPQSWPPSPQAWPNAPQTQPPSTDWSPARPPDPVFGVDGRPLGSKPAQPRRASRLPLILTVLAAIVLAFAGGMVVDHVAVPSRQEAASQPLKDFAVYEQALQDIRDHYVGRTSLTDQQLLYGSISGMVDSLGDTNHTRFLTPQEYQQMTSQLSGKVAGIGILVTDANGALTIVRVIAGSPAESAGVKAGDQITAVGGVSTAGMTFDQLAAKIRGEIGTKVTISVIHAGATTPVDISMTRATVITPLVDWNIIPGTHIADIALFEFSSGAGDQIHQAIVAAQKASATSIVLDLRGNPGGLASEAQLVASEFLSTGVIYLEEDASGARTEVSVDKSRLSTALPMVVLVDHGTASAAEIVAGALQDSLRSKVIGVTTIGTGTVLQPYQLADGSVLLLGVADWLTPAGHRIFGKGITPDQTVALPTGGQAIDPIGLSTMTVAQLQASGDAQLLAALKALGA